MYLRNIPVANGQKVYIEDNFFIQSIDLYIAMNYLNRQGYNIVFDPKLIDDDTFFFTPCIDEDINRTPEIYKLKKAKKIIEILYENNIVKPFTANFDENLFDILGVPFVIKNENEHGGNGKFLIKNMEQLNKFLNFYEKINKYDNLKRRKEAMKEYGVYFDKNGKSESAWTVPIIDFQEWMKKDYVIQEYIKTPTEYNTSLRVLTSSSGDIMCSSLKYHSPSAKKKNYDIISKYLLDEESPFYLGSESVISNTVSGGSSILLGRSNYNDLEKSILEAHSINPDDPHIPSNIEKAAIDIAYKCRREIGAICGLDFIYSEKVQKWYYLEEHELPMLLSYVEQYNLPFSLEQDSYMNLLYNCQLADIDARLNALSMYMKKKTRKKINLKEDTNEFSRYTQF